MEANTVRPTKKQRELLGFIESFIKENGYSPSYREIMNGLGYTSVATVALHVNNLIKRGHLRKRDRSARSLEVVGVELGLGDKAASILEHEAKWLVEQVHALLAELEASTEPAAKKLDDAYVLIGALHVLGLDDAVRSLVPRLTLVKEGAPIAGTEN
jgi:SOS-response transcriptional repressor LexA